jgi:hypothetical protein
MRWLTLSLALFFAGSAWLGWDESPRGRWGEQDNATWVGQSPSGTSDELVTLEGGTGIPPK